MLKSLGVNAFWTKLLGGPLFLVLLTSFWKIAWVGPMLYPPSPLTPPVCITGHSDVSNRIKLLLPNPRHRERAWFVWKILLTFVVEDIIGDNEWLLKNGMTPFSQNLFVDQQIYAAVWGQSSNSIFEKKKISFGLLGRAKNIALILKHRL